MKFSHGLSVFVLIICIGGAIVGAQDKPAPPQTTERADDDLPRIETKFDNDKNETTVGFRILQILGTHTDKLAISAEATYATKVPKEHPEYVTFIISVLHKTGYQYEDGMLLNITTDGKRLPPVLLARLGKQFHEGDYYETMVSLMKYEVFMKLATASEANLQFNQTSFVLRGKHLAKLRELADLLHVPTPDKTA
jgi:hypothetical protein